MSGQHGVTFGHEVWASLAKSAPRPSESDQVPLPGQHRLEVGVRTAPIRKQSVHHPVFQFGESLSGDD
jgi:hypothetical protein